MNKHGLPEYQSLMSLKGGQNNIEEGPERERIYSTNILLNQVDDEHPVPNNSFLTKNNSYKVNQLKTPLIQN